MRAAAVILGVTAAASLAIGASDAVAAKPPCRSYVVTVHYGRETRCDVSPPQRLDVLFTRGTAPARWRGAWGGDGSLAWATEVCLDYGGVPEWHRGTWMRCKDVDY